MTAMPAAMAAATGSSDFTDSASSVSASRAADRAAVAFSTTTSRVCAAFSAMRSLVSEAFSFARPLTSAFATSASTVWPSSWRVLSMSAWISSTLASAPGSPFGPAFITSSADTAGFLHFVDVLLDVGGRLLWSRGDLLQLLLTEQPGDAGDGEEH